MILFDKNWTPLLMEWYDKNKRTLPWRTESPRDPYKVWVSEIMLQQTRVEAVKVYYTNWMEHFPDIPVLAAVEEDEVVRQCRVWVITAVLGICIQQRGKLWRLTAAGCLKRGKRSAN